MFKRQIIVNCATENKLFIPDSFESVGFQNNMISYSADNKVYQYQGNHFFILIVGEIVHPGMKLFNLNTLLSSHDTSNVNLDKVNNALSRCCGRFYIFYSDKNGDFLRSDATSLAQINYSKKFGLIATDINLIKLQNINLEKNDNAYRFYQEVFPTKGNGNAWIGHETIYQHINKVLPNHVIGLQEMHVKRYWPNTEHKYLDFDKTIPEISEELKAILKAFSEIAPLSIAVTAGNDSRVMAAASKDIQDKCYYFIDKLSGMGEQHPDIKIGQQICDTLGIKFNVHRDFLDISLIPASFKDEFFNSVFYATEKRLPEVFNYYKKLSSHINICGVGEFGRSVYGTPVLDVDVNYLCYKYQCVNSDFSKAQTIFWYDNVKADMYSQTYPINSLFYIEQRIGNWGAVGNAESDLAFEEVNPFATHYIMERMLCLPNEFTTYNNNKLFKSITHYLAPELDGVLINPVYTPKRKLFVFLKESFMFSFLDKSKYLIKSFFGKRGC
jgi:hypothetical protein